MRLRYLTIFVLTVFMTNFVNAAEIYNKEGKKLNFFGKINGMHFLSKDTNKNGAQSFAQLGLNGETKIYGNLVGFGMLEHEISIHRMNRINSWNNPTKLGYVGLKFNGIGSIDYGRNYSILHDIDSWTHITPVFGSTISLENTISGPIHGAITYRNEGIFGIADGAKLSLQYQGKNEYDKYHSKEENLKEDNGKRYGISLSYKLGNNISAGAAYIKGKRTIEQQSLHTNDDIVLKNNNKNVEACSLGIKYDTDRLYLAALYGKNHNLTPFGVFSSETEKRKEENQKNFFGFAKQTKDIELVAQYQFDFGLRSSIGYFQSKIHNNSSSLLNNKKSESIRKSINIGASYDLNKDILAFVDYKINLLSSKNEFISKSKIPTGNVVSLGITYKF